MQTSNTWNIRVKYLSHTANGNEKSRLRIYLCQRSYTQGMVDPRRYYCPLVEKANFRNLSLQKLGFRQCGVI